MDSTLEEAEIPGAIIKVENAATIFKQRPKLSLPIKVEYMLGSKGVQSKGWVKLGTFSCYRREIGD